MKLKFFLVLTLFVNSWASSGLQEFKARSLSGEELRFPFPGKIVILSFFSASTLEDLQAWIEILPLSLLQEDKLVFLNILYPGPGFALIPPRKARKSLKTRIDRELQTIAQEANTEVPIPLEKMSIHWIPDFKKKLFKRFKLDFRKSHTFLVDSKSRLRGAYQGFSRIQALNLRLKLKNILPGR